MSDDSNVVSGCASKSSTVTWVLLDVGDDGSFWDGSKGKDVADSQVGVLSGVDELTGVHALVGDESLGVQLESVGVAELNSCKRSSTSRVMDDGLHYTANVTVTLSIIEGSELCWVLVEPGVLQNGASAQSQRGFCSIRGAQSPSRAV